MLRPEHVAFSIEFSFEINICRSNQDDGDAVAMEPVVCDNLPCDVDDVVPSKMALSPVPEIRHRWKKVKKKDQETFLNDPRWRTQICAFLDVLNGRPCCVDICNPQRVCTCTCVSGKLTVQVKEFVSVELFKFALLDFEASSLLVLSWIRYATVLSAARAQQQQKVMSYILPGTNDFLVCRNVIAVLLGYGKKAWYRVKNCFRDGKSIEHGHKGIISNRFEAENAGKAPIVL